MPTALLGSSDASRQPGWLPCLPYFLGGRGFQFFINGSGSLTTLPLQPLKIGFRRNRQQDPEAQAKLAAAKLQRAFDIAQLDLAFWKAKTENRLGQRLQLPPASNKPDEWRVLNGPDRFGRSLTPRAARRFQDKSTDVQQPNSKRARLG